MQNQDWRSTGFLARCCAMRPEDLAKAILRIIRRHDLLAGENRRMRLWDVTPTTTALLDSAARRFAGNDLHRLSLTAYSSVHEPSDTRYGFLFYLRHPQGVIHLHGLTTHDDLIQRLRAPKGFARLPYHEIDDEMLAPDPPQLRTGLDIQADGWWAEDAAQQEASVLQGALSGVLACAQAQAKSRL